MQGLTEITGRHEYTDWDIYYWLTEFRAWSGRDELGQCLHGPRWVGPDGYKSPTSSDDQTAVRVGDGVYGTDGCNRLTNDQAKWVYDTIPAGTAVYSIPGDNTHDYGNACPWLAPAGGYRGWLARQ